MPMIIRTYLLTYLLTHSLVQDIIWKADLSLSLSKKICFLYGTRRFITIFTKARHWTLSWANRIQFAPPIPVSLRSMITHKIFILVSLKTYVKNLVFHMYKHQAMMWVEVKSHTLLISALHSMWVAILHCATGWTTGVRFPAGAVMEFLFLFVTAFRPALGPFSLLSNEFQVVPSPGGIAAGA
jgi:hypothetical protein